jgi:hypothetical protein
MGNNKRRIGTGARSFGRLTFRQLAVLSTQQKLFMKNAELGDLPF